MSFDRGIDPLPLRASAPTMSEGLTMPFCQVCAPPSAVGVWPAVEVGAGAALRCFLGSPRVSIFSPRTRGLRTGTHFRRLLSSITHLMPSIAQFVQVTSPSAVT